MAQAYMILTFLISNLSNKNMTNNIIKIENIYRNLPLTLKSKIS